ncbi:carboxypeptidase-like regulatory domain-containing protein [Glycomyces arizonensis]|uniref:carboxypeptidase-like regulatory domain-containing protein n=1 Tax=Glycomyces arizonensis TaxID=256035 RepID=UPI000417AEBD|nr:carboxypeptidase-like regulatory domain-containing protein [Glycomyces arizonensis]
MTVAAEPSRTKTNVSRSRRGARGRLRARLTGLAAALGVLLGALLLATPASAQPNSFRHEIISGQNPYIDIGGAPATVTVNVIPQHNNPAGQPITVTASLSGLDGYASVDVQDGVCHRIGVGVAQCDAVVQPVQIQFLVAPAPESELPEGQSKSGELKINGGGQSSGEQKTGVTVAGHGGPETVTEVKGTITSNAEPVTDAEVVLTDGEGHEHETTTNDKGEFAFQGSGQDPIAPGEMNLKATREGFEDLDEPITVNAGSSFTQNFTMTPVETEPTETTAAPTSAAPTEASAEPSEEPDEGGLSGTLIVLIIIGGLLVVGGIIGIIFLLRGGKDDDKDDGESFAPDAPPEHQPTAAQVGSPGVYQSGPAPGQDAPTMIHQGPLVQDREVGAYGAPTSGFGPAYGPGSDATQVMPQAGTPSAPPPPAAPPVPPPAMGPDGTQLLPRVQASGPVPPAPGDATQVMPQANMSSRPPQSSFSDPGATQPYPSPTPSPTPPGRRPSPGPGASMFDPPQQPPSGSQPPVSRDPYAPPPSPAPSQPPSQQLHQSQPPQPSADPYPSRGMSRDPYAPQPSQPPQPPASAPPAADPYAPAPTQAMPQGGPGEAPYGSHSSPSPSPSPYAADRPEDEGAPNSRRRDDEERRGWGEWDDRPRSW